MSSLQYLIENTDPLDFAHIARILIQLCDELERFHNNGELHGQVCPAMVTIDDAGRVQLSPPQEIDSISLRLWECLAPEFALNRAPVDYRADIYSLGCVFYSLITGRPMFDGTVSEILLKHQVEDPKPVSDLRPDTPPEFAELCHKMISKPTRIRQQKVSEISTALKDWLNAR